MTHIHRDEREQDLILRDPSQTNTWTDGAGNYLICLLTIHPSEDTSLSCSTPILLFFIFHAMHTNFNMFVLCIVWTLKAERICNAVYCTTLSLSHTLTRHNCVFCQRPGINITSFHPNTLTVLSRWIQKCLLTVQRTIKKFLHVYCSVKVYILLV